VGNVRYIGILVPVFLVLAMAAGLVLRRRIRHFRKLVPAYIIASILLLGLIPVAYYVGALPWKMPDQILYGGRDYYAHSLSCKPRKSYSPLRRRGWVLGYFTVSHPRYAVGDGATPTLLVVEGSRPDCLIVYALSGGP
jgi:hypothetical protein